MAKTKIDFPRTLYKPADKDDPTATKCGNVYRGNAYHSVLVADEEERKAAMQMGYYDDFAKACAADPGDEPEEEEGTSIEADEEETDGASETETEPDERAKKPDTEPDERANETETKPDAETGKGSKNSEIAEDEGF